MNLKRLMRQIHYWLSLAVLLPAGIMFLAGIVLMLKKEIDWIQPPTYRGVAEQQIPEISYQQILTAVQTEPKAHITQWSDIDRIDIRPGKGIAKIQAKSGWEIQIDTKTAKILSTAYRRSDWIESLHDGSYFADGVKLYVFLPAGILLFIMWGTGIYLFLLPRLRKKRKSKAA
ncbi:PepSY domain-containing protein [Parasphingorhabdus sp. DH2-15]|uniref:PepSY domain-containing protein n=1 Tax=Parasphingorhabdus sp. DH2-15 TaxID=3444112 RepID=UPI003F68972D